MQSLLQTILVITSTHRALVQEADLRAVADAASLVAVREAASLLLHYGSHVALTHIKPLFLDIPSVCHKLTRVLQALQRDCVAMCPSKLKMPGAVLESPGAEDIGLVGAHMPPLTQLKDPGPLIATGAMWSNLMAQLDRVGAHARHSRGVARVLVLVDAAAEEFAFQVIAGSGITTKKFCNSHPEENAARNRQVGLLWL